MRVPYRKRLHLASLLMGGTLLVALFAARAGGEPASQCAVAAHYGAIPLRFEPNEAHSAFVARGCGFRLTLTHDGALFTLARPKNTVRPRRLPGREAAQQLSPASLHLRVAGANPTAKIRGTDVLPGAANYLTGNDPKRWRIGVPTYAKVCYGGVYPGIDLIYYGNQGQLEYDFVVQPGADPRRIRLAFDHAKSLRVDEQGNLIVQTAEGTLHWHRPVLYQRKGALSLPVAGRYALRGNQQVGFAVARYDRTKPLVIDPTLTYSTYLGGGTSLTQYPASEFPTGVVVDRYGHAFVTGYTYSSDFPAQPTGAHFGKGGGNTDVFVAELSAKGTSLLYSTVIGGSGDDQANAIALDSVGNAYITGITKSTDFPTTKGVLQPKIASSDGSSDAFILKLSSDGSHLRYSTYLGGDKVNENSDGWDGGFGIAADAQGNAYVTGYTASLKFPTTPGAYRETKTSSATDGFVAKLNATASSLLYSTLLGSPTYCVGYGIAVDKAGSAYITGTTAWSGFPTTPGAAQTTFGGYYDGFVAKFHPDGATLDYCTYLGGSDWDDAYALALDADGYVYVTGDTASADFPVTKGAYTTLPVASSTNRNVFVVKLAPNAAPVYAATFGGTRDDVGHSIMVDSAGRAYVTGEANSYDFPVTEGVLQRHPNGVAAFLIKLASDGSAPIYSTLFGGTLSFGYGIALDSFRNVYLLGRTAGNDLKTTTGAYSRTLHGMDDAFIAKLNIARPTLASLRPAAIGIGSTDFKLNTYGSGFLPTSVVQWNGRARPTVYVSPSRLIASIAASDVTSAGIASVTVANPPDDGGLSNSQKVRLGNLSLYAAPVLERDSSTGEVTLTLYVYDTSDITAYNVTVSNLKIEAMKPNEHLPLTLGDIVKGNARWRAFHFPAAVGDVGASVTITWTITYIGGSYSDSVNTVLP